MLPPSCFGRVYGMICSLNESFQCSDIVRRRRVVVDVDHVLVQRLLL